MQLFTQKISIAIFNKNIHNQNDAQKSGQLRYIKKLSIALVQTKVINCNFANKVVSCNLCTQKLSQLRRNLAIFEFCFEFCLEVSFEFHYEFCFEYVLNIVLNSVLMTDRRTNRPTKKWLKEVYKCLRNF